MAGTAARRQRAARVSARRGRASRLGVVARQCRQAKKLRALPKNAPEIDDALGALATASLPILRARVPDLARLAALIWSLHRGDPPRP
jgi:hypothetical protein